MVAPSYPIFCMGYLGGFLHTLESIVPFPFYYTIFFLICHGIGEYYVVPVRISFAGALWYSSPLGFTLQEAFDVMKFFHTGGKYSSSFLL